MEMETPQNRTDSLVSIPLTDADRQTVDWDQYKAETSQIEEHEIEEEQEQQLDELNEPKEKEVMEDTDEDMAALLAKLEEQNNALATDPKAGIRSPSPTMLLPGEEPVLNLYEFWTLVTRDYQEALRKLPTVAPRKIREGIPPILRSAVWVGLAGARDEAVGAEYDRLLGQETPVESTISKDLARTFPAVDMFKDSEGEGQKALGNLLRCFSLYDPEIGYCQGMGFVAGTLLMNMDEKDAFCVFVKLMEEHGLRTSYLPSLAGLHSQIYKFKRLLTSLSPSLVDHFDDLGMEFAYLSPWFLTIFATSCPLPLLFRIYDVILAEGAEETIMRVALALMLRNEAKLLEMTELENVVQLLLGKSIWTFYESDPDTLFEEVGTVYHSVATKEALEKLQEGFTAETQGDESTFAARSLGFSQSMGFRPFKFLDGLWAPSPRAATLSPEAPSFFEGSAGFLKRSNSKRSIATINSISAVSGTETMHSTDSYASTASTAPTEVEGGLERTKSIRSVRSAKSVKTVQQEDKNWHEQVEGLLMAMTEVQRQHAETASELESAQRNNDELKKLVESLSVILRQKTAVDAVVKQRRKTLPSRVLDKPTGRPNLANDKLADIQHIIDAVKDKADAPLESSLAQLSLVFEAEKALTNNFSQRSQSVGDAGKTTATIRALESEVAKMRRRVLRQRSKAHLDNVQKLRRDIVGLRLNADACSPTQLPPRRRSDIGPWREQLHYGKTRRKSSSARSPRSTSPAPSVLDQASETHLAPPTLADWVPETTLEQSLSRPEPPTIVVQPSQPKHQRTFSKRTSSLAAQPILSTQNHQPPAEETLLVELVEAKIREALAIQERDEMKQQLDRMRKAMAAQQEAHLAELESLRKGSPAGSLPPTPGEERLSPSPALTPDLVPPKGSAGGGGWFWGVRRTASTSAASGM